MHELHADRTAVSVAQAREHLAQGQGLGAKDGAARELAVEIVATQTVELRIELFLRQARQTERVDLGHHVTAHAVGANQRVYSVLTDRYVGDAVVPTTGAGEAIGLAVARTVAVDGRRVPIRVGSRGIEQAGATKRGPELGLAAEVRVGRQLGEVGLPVLRHQVRVFQIVRVQPFGEREAQCVDGALGQIVFHGGSVGRSGVFSPCGPCALPRFRSSKSAGMRSV